MKGDKNVSIIKFNQYHEDDINNANYFAQLEINSFVDFCNLMQQQMARTVLFRNIDFDSIKDSVLEETMKNCFDKEGYLNNDYVGDFIEAYKDFDSTYNDDYDDDEEELSYTYSNNDDDKDC